MTARPMQQWLGEAAANAAAGREVGWGDPPAWPGALHIRLSQLTLVRKLLHGA